MTNNGPQLIIYNLFFIITSFMMDKVVRVKKLLYLTVNPSLVMMMRFMVPSLL